MYILGLTGSIGMGKTTAARAFKTLGIPVYDADTTIHKLMNENNAVVAEIKKIFPEAVKNNIIDRNILGSMVFGDMSILRELEKILHPRARVLQYKFMRCAAKNRQNMIVLDIPLLFETKGDQFCDAVIVVSAPSFVQRSRVLARANMTEKKFIEICNRQLSDKEKRIRANYIIPTGLGKSVSLTYIKKIIKDVKTKNGYKWLPRKGLYIETNSTRY
jgi:dephospho-CoA kinase